MSVRSLFAVICSCLAPAAFAQSSMQGMQGSSMQKPTGNLEVPKSPKEVLDMLHHGNEMEIRLAELAQRKGQDSSVKDLAQMIMQDHRTADQQVMQLARQMKIRLSEPHERGANKKLDELGKQTQSALDSLEGAPFDQLYTSVMVMDHDKDISLLQAARPQLQGNAQLSQLIDSLLPTLDKHRSQALQALQQVQPKLMTGVGGAGQQQQGQQEQQQQQQPGGSEQE